MGRCVSYVTFITLLVSQPPRHHTYTHMHTHYGPHKQGLGIRHCGPLTGLTFPCGKMHHLHCSPMTKAISHSIWCIKVIFHMLPQHHPLFMQAPADHEEVEGGGGKPFLCTQTKLQHFARFTSFEE